MTSDGSGSPMITIKLTNAHGQWETTVMHLDRTMAHHLPASPNMLRERLEALTTGNYHDVGTVSEFLVMLSSTTEATK